MKYKQRNIAVLEELSRVPHCSLKPQTSVKFKKKRSIVSFSFFLFLTSDSGTSAQSSEIHNEKAILSNLTSPTIENVC